MKINHFLKAVEHVKKNNSKLHIMGLVSDGGVHSYPTHIKALHDFAVKQGITPYMHAFMDGRDTPQVAGIGYLKDLIDPWHENCDSIWEDITQWIEITTGTVFKKHMTIW